MKRDRLVYPSVAGEFGLTVPPSITTQDLTEVYTPKTDRLTKVYLSSAVVRKAGSGGKYIKKLDNFSRALLRNHNLSLEDEKFEPKESPGPVEHDKPEHAKPLFLPLLSLLTCFKCRAIFRSTGG